VNKNDIILVTGAAGFIASETCKIFLKNGYQVVGIDNLNNYYDVKLKKYRLKILSEFKKFHFEKTDIENFNSLEKLFNKFKFTKIVNLAARAGVRYSLVDPFVYIKTNVEGTGNLLELAHRNNVNKFILASTSSLYAGQPTPFSESLPVNEPLSPYAATKKGAEALCYAYHHNYGIDTTILRYFTVYGPAGRPDMSYFRFIKWIAEDTKITVYGDGSQSRDFTFVEDIAQGTFLATLKNTKYQVINLGGNKPHKLSYLIQLIEDNLNKKAKINYQPFHKADMQDTWAQVEKAEKILGWKAKIPLEEGIKKCIKWYYENEDFVRKIEV
jgi:nucleoside-diphosphate-sugar epimerase